MRSLLAAAALLVAGCVSPVATQPQIAITIDDLPVHGPYPAGENPIEVAHKVILALKAHDIEAYGFANGSWTQKDPSTAEVLRAWKDAGLPLGNHGWSHRHLNEMSGPDFEKELVANDQLLQPLSTGDGRWFRYPYLDEGESAEKRAASRDALARHDYKVAAVTMDFSDWAWTGPYARCRDTHDEAAVKRLEEMYLQAARESIGYYRQMSRTVYGRDIPYVLLLHISAFEARMLPRLLQLYRDEGFRFVGLPEAEGDPAYADQTDPRRPAEPQGLQDKASAAGPLPKRTNYQPILERICAA